LLISPDVLKELSKEYHIALFTGRPKIEANHSLKHFKIDNYFDYKITMDDLPELITLSTNLSNKTILLRQVPEHFRCGINYIIGKPGVGKSHYVEELTKVHNDAIVYRFWVSAHDEHLRHRLQYDAFLTDIGLKAFKSPRSFCESELAEQLRTKDMLLIIDGLDHVENYNPQELPSYLSFLELLEKSNIRTVVLSRPMKASLPWEFIELINWNFSETTIYLAAAHNISDYDISKKLYECTNGYPIITYFLAEHFNKYGELNLQIPIGDIDVYYDELLQDVVTASSGAHESVIASRLEVLPEEDRKVILRLIDIYLDEHKIKSV